jgi:hypothetical protein
MNLQTKTSGANRPVEAAHPHNQFSKVRGFVSFFADVSPLRPNSVGQLLRNAALRNLSHLWEVLVLDPIFIGIGILVPFILFPQFQPFHFRFDGVGQFHDPAARIRVNAVHGLKRNAEGDP